MRSRIWGCLISPEDSKSESPEVAYAVGAVVHAVVHAVVGVITNNKFWIIPLLVLSV